MWPIGSGEVYGYRTDRNMPAEVRAAVTPKKRMDNPRGEWNTFEITLKADRLWVKLNGEEVITDAQLPGMPETGPLALQHHGGYDAKSRRWTGPCTQRMLCTFCSGTQVVVRQTRPRDATT